MSAYTQSYNHGKVLIFNNEHVETFLLQCCEQALKSTFMYRFALGIDWIKAKRVEGMWETGRTDFS